MTDGKVDMSTFDNRWYDRGRGPVVRLLWYVVNTVVFRQSWCVAYGVKRALLRMFGARVGRHVIIKPRVNIRAPWFLELGDYAALGEGVWIENLARVSVGAHATVSQGALLVTGNHDWSSPSFDLVLAPIEVGRGAWIGTRAVVCPGTTCGDHAVVCAGSTAGGHLEPYGIYRGNPAARTGRRHIAEKPDGGEPPS